MLFRSNSNTGKSIDVIYNIVGCWQGWYSQYSMKTYFDFLFIAKEKNTFIGISIEPINDHWGNHEELIYNEKLYASIEGHIEDDILVSFKKTYLLERPWSINYDGVIIEDGKYFEGEWSASYLNGSFNAMRTKSLFPIRIFDIENQRPVVATKYLDNCKELNSTWFVQITGKEKMFAILNVIEIEYKIYANLIFEHDKEFNFMYFEGEYEEFNKVVLIEHTIIEGSALNMLARFNIDWTSKQINGTIKDDRFKLRSLKGYKL